MKVSELRHALTFVDDDDNVEFLASSGKGLTHVASPTHAQITTKWEIPKRGDLTLAPDDLPKTMTIHLEI
jgi:hypothetical protein